MSKSKTPNIYGRKPSAVLNADNKVVETFDSRREARRARPALAKEQGQSVGSLRIVANGPQEVVDAPALRTRTPIPLDACDSSLAPRRAHPRAPNEPGPQAQGYRRRYTAPY
jgi:hypothetical protein